MSQPLADRMRPLRLDHVVGQSHLLAKNKPLRRLLEAGHIHSMVFWGPSGTGKTTLARLMASYVDAHWIQLMAVESGVKQIREAIEQAQKNKKLNIMTVLFVDEVHRFNKTQQDTFLPYIEDGTIIFIGATTENPSFELNNALLSRCRVFVLKAIQASDLLILVNRGLDYYQKKDKVIVIGEEIKELIVCLADGDARRALGLLELSIDALSPGQQELTEEDVHQVAGLRVQNYDKGGDQFYQQISAFHKSVRGSDPDASLYWLARMICAGCDPFYIARRLTVIASEDIGNADPRALTIAIDAWEALKRLGQPEGELALAQATTYLASSPKSNASYAAYSLAKKDAVKSAGLSVPKHLRNASTGLQKEMGCKQGYHYAHDNAYGYSPGQDYFPQALPPRHYYKPVNRGLESKIAERLTFLKQLRPLTPVRICSDPE